MQTDIRKFMGTTAVGQSRFFPCRHWRRGGLVVSAGWTSELEVGGLNLVSAVVRQETLFHIVSFHPGV